MTAKWFRDNCGLVIQVMVANRKNKTYNYVIIDLNSEEILHSNYLSPYSSYEEAEKDALNNLISFKKQML